MRNQLTAIMLASVALCSALTVLGSAFGDTGDEPGVLLGPVPQIVLNPGDYATTKDEKRRITELIDRLKDLDTDFGGSHLVRRVPFAPIKDDSAFGIFFPFGKPEPRASEFIEELVEFGPKALPQLLERLTDETVTKLVIEHGGSFGIQWYGREIPLNLANPADRRIHRKFEDALDDIPLKLLRERHVSRHVVTIGDICFVAIGQIVNRVFLFSRYQLTSCRVINSPTHDPVIAEIVRALWSDENAAQKLVDSLLCDLYTKYEDDRECGAVMRLAYYFPQESAQVILNRLNALDLRRLTSANDPTRLRQKNGVRVDDFLKSIRTCSHPAIIDALVVVMERTDDPEKFHAVLTDVVVQRDSEFVYTKLRQFLSARLRTKGDRPDWEYYLLHVSAHYFPDRSEELFESYREYNTPEVVQTVIFALREPVVPRPWMTNLLGSFLDDTTKTRGEYGPKRERHRIRICDEAAKVLARSYLKDVRFEYEQNPAHLDLQIAKIKRLLAVEKPD